MNTVPYGLLQPLPIPNQVWDDVAMDFITGLPILFCHTIIVVVIDRLSKYANFMALKFDYTSKQMAEDFIRNIVKFPRVPKSIVSDKDKVFTSKFWQHLFQLQGSAYHPQSDGKYEALNKSLEMYLRCFTFHNPKMWYKTLAWVEFWYNIAYHMSLGMTPFKVLYGREPPTISKYNLSINDPADL